MSQKEKSFEMDMCRGPLMRQLVTFSVPLILASNLQLLFNAVDLIVVGKFTGESALAAVGSTTALINTFITILTGISLGTSVLCGQFYAAKRKQSMEDLVHTCIAFALVSGIVMGILGILFSKSALRLMGTPISVLPQANLYMCVYMMGMPAFMLYTFGAAILRAVGDTKRPMVYLTLAGVLNAGLNLFLVIVFDLGVLGVAVATVISQILSAVLVLRCLMQADGIYRVVPKKLHIKLPLLHQMFRIGLPAGLQSLVMNFSNILLQSSVNSLGQTAMAGYTAANNLFGFLYVTANSFTQTVMAFVSQNYGAGNWKRIGEVIRKTVFLSAGSMLVMGSLVFFFREPLLGIYTDSGDAVKAGAEVFLYTTTTYFLFNIVDLLPGAMRGFGYSTIPMILTALGTVGVRIFWIYAIFPTYHKLDQLFLSYPASWIVTLLMLLVYFIHVWRKATGEYYAHHARTAVENE